AMAGRSRHRSQDMGQLQRPGPSVIRLGLIETRAGGRGEGDGLFAGVDTVLHGQARFVALVDTARALLNPSRPAAIVPLLARALYALGSAPADSGQRAPREVALAAAAGVSLDGVADDGIVVGGERIQIEATVWNAGDSTIRLDGLEVAGPPGWVVERLDAAASPVAPGAVATRRFAVTVAPDAPRSQPYFLRRPLAGALYDWTGVPAAWRGLPFEPPLLAVTARVVIAGAPVTLSREVVYRFRDQAIGEVRRPLFVTRAFDVAVSPGLVVWPTRGAGCAPRWRNGAGRGSRSPGWGASATGAARPTGSPRRWRRSVCRSFSSPRTPSLGAICHATTRSSSGAAPTRPSPRWSRRTAGCSTTPGGAASSSCSTSNTRSSTGASPRIRCPSPGRTTG